MLDYLTYADYSTITVCYALLCAAMMIYPVSGFIADVYCGRLRTAGASLAIIFTAALFLVIALTIIPSQRIVYTILIWIAFFIGLAGYQANFIQLGLDQLFEAPSHYLGLFIHYATLAFYSGSILSQILVPTHTVYAHTVRCVNNQTRSIITISTSSIFACVYATLLLVGRWKRKWFTYEVGWPNPYKTVYRVLKFAKEYSYPLQRSAFTYSDNYIPSRLDFAKERFGGPFTTEQVEDVKTLLRILLILLAIGPTSVLEVPGSSFVFPLFGIHALHIHEYEVKSGHCVVYSVWKLYMGSGGMKDTIATVAVFPLYILLIFSLLRKRLPKLFTRLGVGIVLCLLGVVSLLIIDVVGHSMATHDGDSLLSNSSQSECMFQISPRYVSTYDHSKLNMSWTVLILPSLLLGVGPMLVFATTLEFISAQSPQSMKGLLVGVFFAIRGLFQFLNSITIVPLSLRKKPWASASGEMLVTNCGFVYLLLTCVSGLIGLILFLVAAKRYKYRTRDEGMFSQQEVEEVYDRYINQTLSN